MKILIVGGVAGGATAAARIRRNSENAEIVIFEKGEYISYANCGLPYYIGGVIREREKLFVQTPAAFGRRFNVDVRTNSEVVKIDPAAKQVSVRKADGTVYNEGYDKLLLSPGASPVMPPLKGSDSGRIFTLRNVSDTDRIKAFIDSNDVRKAVIVGGGFIGLEMAENLRHAGIEVAVVEMADQVMGPVDYSVASFVHGHLQEKGVDLYLEQAVESFEDTGDGIIVRFKSGESVGAQLVVMSIGVRPETRLASEAGLKIGEARGIYVDEYLRTSDADIYAVGDAIEFPHPITGRPWLNFLAGPANRQARIVADNIVFGDRIAYEGSIGTAIAKVFDMTVASTGLPAKRLKQLEIPYLSATVHPGSNAGYYPGARPMTIKITFAPDSGRLYGAQIVGYSGVDKRIDEFAMVIKRGGTVHDLVLTEQAYAPPFSSAKDPVAVAGYVAGNILSGKMHPVYWRELKDMDISGVTLLDVRTQEEFDLGNIPGSVNIPVDDLRERLGEIPADKPVVIYCGVGLRGYLASNILRQNGFSDVRNLIGGIRTYKAAVTRPCRPGQSSEACEMAAKEACPCVVDTDADVAASAAPAGASRDSVSVAGLRATSSKVITIDACGIQCPGPILKLKKGIDEAMPGTRLEILSTDQGFMRDAEAWCRTTGHRFISKSSEGGCFKVTVEKSHSGKDLSVNAGAGCAVPAGGSSAHVSSSAAAGIDSPAIDSLTGVQYTPPPRPSATPDGKTIIVFSDDLDKVLASFVLANGAAATGGKVSMFFTFWGLNAIKKDCKPKVKKDFFGRMFGMMLPSSSRKLGLSKMNMAGIGSRMMRRIMKAKGVDSLESLRAQAIENGVEFIACQMSMDVMGVKKEELLDNVSVGGVATYMERAVNSGVNLFI